MNGLKKIDISTNKLICNRFAMSEYEKRNSHAIDFVVPMVFHDDVLWQESFKNVHALYNENDKFQFVRWRSWGTEELMIKCVRKYVPFARTIYILIAQESQKKDWMEQDGVKVVLHREFIPEKFLPTFNSCTIEMFLHKIPGISDRFIYANDDMYPLSTLSEDDFFCDDIPVQHCGFKAMPATPNIFHNLCLSGLNFVAKEFGQKYTDMLLKGGHGFTPVLKETCEYLWKIGGDRIEASISPFREGKNFSQWIYMWWHHLGGNYIDGGPETKYMNTGRSVEEIVDAIRNGKGIVCINDNECEHDYMKYGRAVKEALGEKLK